MSHGGQSVSKRTERGDTGGLQEMRPGVGGQAAGSQVMEDLPPVGFRLGPTVRTFAVPPMHS